MELFKFSVPLFSFSGDKIEKDCFDYYSEDYSSGKCCRTENGIPCVFPFKFRGVERNYCISGPIRKEPWCPTEVNSDGVPILGQWGYCKKLLECGISNS